MLFKRLNSQKWLCLRGLGLLYDCGPLVELASVAACEQVSLQSALLCRLKRGLRFPFSRALTLGCFFELIHKCELQLFYFELCCKVAGYSMGESVKGH